MLQNNYPKVSELKCQFTIVGSTASDAGFRKGVSGWHGLNKA